VNSSSEEKEITGEEKRRGQQWSKLYLIPSLISAVAPPISNSTTWHPFVSTSRYLGGFSLGPQKVS